ncbi:hypothetical protein [Synechococcus phage S-B68]|nr:hypothetical protein [Synechococcus phage S-B68]
MTNFEPSPEKAFEQVRSAALLCVASVYVAGGLAGRYFYNNRERLLTDVADFWSAFSTGARSAIEGTYALGQDARRAWVNARPSVDRVLDRLEDLHNNVSDRFRR